ncbi:MAG: hypothetical protein O2854_09880 [Chloroflexi bacterium]|nr:hypothetical protein [Chloroflexota bacterium]
MFDAARTFSIVLPEGWTHDLEFGRSLIGDQIGLPNLVKFFGGRQIATGFDPNILIISLPVPSGSDIEAVADEVISGFSEGASTATSDSNIERFSVSFLGLDAVKFVYSDVSDPNFPDGFESTGIIIVRNNVMWELQCSGGLELRDELDRCIEALESFRFE